MVAGDKVKGGPDYKKMILIRKSPFTKTFSGIPAAFGGDSAFQENQA
jgi:hypothetical protein